ncbi:MAG: aminoglycoside phosphotransferase family protein [Sphingomonadaceae bacterium]
MPELVPTPQDISPDWVSALWQARGLDARVTDIAYEPIGTGQVGATYRFTLTYAGDCGAAPATIVGKFPSNDPLSRETGKSHMTYIRESRFYQQFAGTKPLPVPHHHFIAFDEDSHAFALIMDDLPRHRAGNQLSFPTPDETKAAIRAAAAIHAAWWGDPRLDRLEWLNGTKAVPPPLDLEALYTAFWPAFCDRYGERVTPSMKQVGDAFFGHINAWATDLGGARCLTHNDFRPDNMLYDLSNADQPIVIVDWQTTGVGHGTGDIAYYMGTALDSATRRDCEAMLFALYCDELEAQGVERLNRGELWDDYRRAAFGGFLMGVTASIVVEQTDRGDAMFLTMCERSAAMVSDHGQTRIGIST